jgi:hypothetical protein
VLILPSPINGPEFLDMNWCSNGKTTIEWFWMQKRTSNVLVSIDWNPNCEKDVIYALNRGLYFSTLSKCNVSSEFVQECWISP